MDTYFSTRRWLTRLLVVPLVLVGILFLEPCILPRCDAQQDEKDKVIEQQRKLIETQKRQIDDFDQRMREFRAAIETQLRLNNEEIKRVLENQKKQNDAFQKALEGRKVELLDAEARIRDLQAKLIASQEQANAERIRAAAVEANAKLMQARVESLLEMMRELQVKKAQAEVKEAGNPKRATDSNPPDVAVNGKIEKIVGDLVQINVGSDHGLAKDHTLEIFRTTPQAKYLGRLRIVEAGTMTSICRLIPTIPNAKVELKVGDQVSSRLK